MHALFPVYISLSALLLAASGAARVMQLHETTQLPHGFSSLGPASPETILDMRMALKQRDSEGLIDALMAVSEPTSSRYGQYLTKEETEAFLAPAPETVDAIESWFGQNGIVTKTISPAGDWIAFSVPVSKANTLFGTEFSTFKHLATGRETIRTLEYSIPADLAPHVALVHPTISFPSFKDRSAVVSAMMPLPESAGANHSSRATVPTSCATTITPACVQDMYGLPNVTAVAPGNLLWFTDLGLPSSSDVQSGLSAFLPSPRQGGTRFCTEATDGSMPRLPSQGSQSIEADIGIEYAVALVDGIPVCYIEIVEDTRDGELGEFLDVINFVASQSVMPLVLTFPLVQNENTVSRAMANSLCTASASFGARGVSILVASGDGGVAGAQTTRCTNFLPTFPGDCPFVTSVGATSGVPETAASFSSGGFSNFFATPSYQGTAVSSYLTHLGGTNAGLFNRSGRAFPDVAAIGDNIEVIFQQQAGLVAGTETSLPIFAATITLLNDRLLAAGKPALGFLNPFLYGPAAAAGAFSDITTGNNPGCNTQGFPAAAGWDPVTGLGTPNFAALAVAAGVP